MMLMVEPETLAGRVEMQGNDPGRVAARVAGYEQVYAEAFERIQHSLMTTV